MTNMDKVIVEFITEYYKKNMFYPDYDEIAEGIGRVKSTVHRHMKRLERDGVIIRKEDCSPQYRLINTDSVIKPDGVRDVGGIHKSILVTDTPKNCTECPLEIEICDTEGKTLLNANICRGCGYRNMNSVVKPDWCPLKDLPEKRPEPHFTGETAYSLGIDKGWNNCIDNILKGVN